MGKVTTVNTDQEVAVNRRVLLTSAASSLVAAAGSIVTVVVAPVPGLAHEGHDHGNFSAGEPGDPKRPARVVKVRMREEGSKKFFEPSRIEVRRGEQIRFAIQNDGSGPHEFVLATAAENRKHADEMKKLPEMEHDDPNAKRVQASKSADLVWKFTKRGEFQFACVIPGHYDAAMFGTVVVK
jgi:uncharacterized cupredoxin-like copper-binding protein